jgi:hypothetical protein
VTLSAADRLEIAERITRISHAIDRGDSDGVADCFTANGQIVVTGLDVEVDHSGDTTGHDAIVLMASGVFDLIQGYCRHWNGLPVIDETPSGVSVTSYLQIVRAGSAPWAGIMATGIYTDHLARIDDTWLVTRREVQMDPQSLHRSLTPTDPLILRHDDFVRAAEGAALGKA